MKLITLAAAGAAMFPVLRAAGYHGRVAAIARSFAHEQTGKAPPGPAPLMLLGNSLALESAGHEKYCCEISRQFPDASLLLFFVGASPFLVANSPEVVKRVLATSKYTKPRYVGYRSRAVERAVQQEASSALELGMAPSADQNEHPDASRPAFANVVKQKFPAVESLVVARGGVQDEASIHQLVTEANFQLLFNVKDPERARRVSALLRSTGLEFQRRLTNPYRWVMQPLSNIGYVRDIVFLLREAKDLVRQMDGQSADEKSTAWVHAWITREGMHPVRYLGKIMGLLVASTQTVPTGASWAIKLLLESSAEDPRILERCLTEPEYLDAVCKEALRLHPPFPLIQRAAIEDDVINGYRIPKGTVINVVPAVLHRHPKHWQRPDDFDPERFLSADAEISPYAFLPFGRGPRMCIGSQLGMMEMAAIVRTALQRVRGTSA